MTDLAKLEAALDAATQGLILVEDGSAATAGDSDYRERLISLMLDSLPDLIAAARERDALREALADLWVWCANWDTEFMDDPEFPETRAKVELALTTLEKDR